MQAICDQIQEIDKLTEYDALNRRILIAEIDQFFDQSFNFGRGTPLVYIETTKDALSNGCSYFIINVESRGF